MNARSAARSARHVAVRCGVVLAMVAAIGVTHHEAASRRAAWPAEKDLVYLPSPGSIRVASLGHRELAADLVFMKSVLYFGSQLVTTKDYTWLDQHLDAVNELSPRFRTPYLFGTRATMYNGLPIDNAGVLRSTHFAEAGLRQFPDDWELAFTVGCNYLFEMHTDDPQQKAEWKRKGGDWIRRASLVGGGPVWLPGLASKIMSEEGQNDAELEYLTEVFLNAPTDAAREEARRLLLARRARNLAALEAAGKDFDAAWQRVLPYGPPDLYVAFGEPRSPRLDLAFLGRDEVLEAVAAEERAAHERAIATP